MKTFAFSLLLVLLPWSLSAQNPEDQIKTKGLPKIPNLTNAGIPGAPILGQPMLLKGATQEIRTEKHGLAYPAFFDWNHDGKDDLLLGEFETGGTGSNIKVYLNKGTTQKPSYSSTYFYATDVKGDTLTAYQWCCIGTHPRVVDLDRDGYLDILTGQYNPGLISWWRGSANGFLPKQYIEQEGYVVDMPLEQFAADDTNPKNNNYWNYSSADFGDFNGDGLLDLFVGGSGSEFRVALNVGTKEHPKFGLRKHLLGLDGLPISVVKPDERELKEAAANFRLPHRAGVHKTFVTPFDWDNDGVLDLLVTHAYYEKKARDPFVFFRGVQTDKGLRFEEAQPLFKLGDAVKIFPGCQPNIAVTDFNHDGVNDLVVGVSIPTVNGFEVDSLLTWSFLRDLNIETPGKDAGVMIKYMGGVEGVKKIIQEQPQMKQAFIGTLNDEKYFSVRHRGYVYVFLGKKNSLKAEPKIGVLANEEVKIINKTSKSNGEGAVSYVVNAPAAILRGDTTTLEVLLSIQDGWYGYADTQANKSLGLIPTTVTFALPEGMEPIGQVQLPSTKQKGLYQVYKGKNIRFSQKIRLNHKNAEGDYIHFGDHSLMVNIQYQTCNDDLCLPPVNAKEEMKIMYSTR